MSPVMTALEPKPEPGQKHLHLFGSCILGLIEDDKGVVERSASHEGQGSDFDDAPFQQSGGPIKIHHVMEGIIEGAEVRVDLFSDVPRQKSKLFARLHCRSGQDNPLDLLLHEGGNSHGHGKIGLPCSRRTDADDEIISPNGIDVTLLGKALGRNDPLFGRDVNRIQKDVLKVGGPIVRDHSYGIVDIRRDKGIPFLQKGIEVI